MEKRNVGVENSNQFRHLVGLVGKEEIEYAFHKAIQIFLMERLNLSYKSCSFGLRQ